MNISFLMFSPELSSKFSHSSPCFLPFFGGPLNPRGTNGSGVLRWLHDMWQSCRDKATQRVVTSDIHHIYIYIRAAAPAADPGKESGIAGVQKRCGKIRWSTLFFLDFALQLFEKVKQYLTKYTWRRWLLGLGQMPQCSNFFKGWWNRKEPRENLANASSHAGSCTKGYVSNWCSFRINCS